MKSYLAQHLFIYIFFAFLFIKCKNISPPPLIHLKQATALDAIKVPPNFTIDFFAKDVKNARSMCIGNKGSLFVGTRNAGKVYALLDNNNDFKSDTLITIAKGLNMPNGVAFKDGALYVAEVNKIWRYDAIEDHLLDKQINATLISDQFPKDLHHGWKYIQFGPDGKLYIPVGAPCNVCEESDERYASIMRMNPDGSDLEIYAKGIRNSVGFDWHPKDGVLWFTENGRDWLDDDTPPCELNKAPEANMHFGFPYCHGGTISDPEFGAKKPCDEFTAPAQNLAAHVAPLGLCFYDKKAFPSSYHQQIFIAEHGSWNRSTKIGYRISLVRLNDKHEAIAYNTFAEGWLDTEGKVSGRPVDVLVWHDGSLLVSDDFSDAIYRISYKQ